MFANASTPPSTTAPHPHPYRSAPTSGSTFLRRHAWFGVLVVGAVLFVGVERTLVATQNPNIVPAAILLGAAVVPAAFVAFISGAGCRTRSAVQPSAHPPSSVAWSA